MNRTAGDATAAASDQHPARDAGAAMRAGAQALGRELATIGRAPGVTVDHALLGAYAAAAAPNSLRAFRADVTAFDAWCHARGCRCLPASPQLAASFLSARAGDGAAPASL